MRDVFLGRGPRARPEHQLADGSGGDPPAFKAVAEAQRLAPNASEKEQALIAALAKRYGADETADRVALDIAYADAMQEVAERFPDDLDIATLYAESLMDLSPWNYWADGGKTPTGRTADLIATLEGVLKANPDHIGAIHLYIHAVEASDDPKRARALCRPAGGAEPVDRPPDPHAGAHLLPRRALSRLAGGQQGGVGRRRGLPRRR